jgi:hypothetical protein
VGRRFFVVFNFTPNLRATVRNADRGSAKGGLRQRRRRICSETADFGGDQCEAFRHDGLTVRPSTPKRGKMVARRMDCAECGGPSFPPSPRAPDEPSCVRDFLSTCDNSRFCETEIGLDNNNARTPGYFDMSNRRGIRQVGVWWICVRQLEGLLCEFESAKAETELIGEEEHFGTFCKSLLGRWRSSMMLFRGRFCTEDTLLAKRGPAEDPPSSSGASQGRRIGDEPRIFVSDLSSPKIR